MMKPMRRHLILASMAHWWLAGCASPNLAPQTVGQPIWQGRVAVQHTPMQGTKQSMSAQFELQGNAEQGLLTLFSPIGTTLARIHWTAAGAQLEQGQQTQWFADLETLGTQLTGMPISIAQWFQWFNQPNPVATPEWHITKDPHHPEKMRATHAGAQGRTDIVILLSTPPPNPEPMP
jgi:outer membrane lipoprotein LolB